MVIPATINQQFVDGINKAVDKVVAARRVLPARTVETRIIPAHEDYLQNMVHWRLDQLSSMRVFGAYGLTPHRGVEPTTGTKLAGVPGAIQTAYNAQAATITTAYNTKVNALKTQLNSILKDAQAKEKVANKVKDKATLAHLKSAVAQAKQAYKDGVKAADVMRQSQMTALANNFQNLLNQAAQSNNTLPPPSAGGGGGTVIGGVTQYPIYDASGNFIGYTTQPAPNQTAAGGNPSNSGGGVVPSSSGGQVYDDGSAYNPGAGGPAPVDPAQTGAPATSVIDDLFAFLNVFLGGGTPVPSSAPPVGNMGLPPGTAPVYPTAGVVTQYDQSSAGLPNGGSPLDVFDQDPWGGSAQFGEFVPMFGNRTIRRLNQMPVMPKSSFGYAQWGTIISGVIQAAGQVGAAAATSALAPSVKNTAAAPVVLQQPAPAPSNMWLIGGGAAVVALGLALLLKRK